MSLEYNVFIRDEVSQRKRVEVELGRGRSESLCRLDKASASEVELCGADILHSVCPTPG